MTYSNVAGSRIHRTRAGRKFIKNLNAKSDARKARLMKLKKAVQETIYRLEVTIDTRFDVKLETLYKLEDRLEELEQLDMLLSREIYK